MAMFPQFGATAGAPAAGGTAPLLSFKAGKMKLSDKGNDTFHVTPDTRKGTVSLFKGPDDQLMHFAWKERPSGRSGDDIIILPEEAVYKKVDTGTEGERVFILELAGNRRFFYWMQDKNSDKDEENTKKVNSLINFPPAEDAAGARGAAGSPDMMDFLGSMAGAGAIPSGSTLPAGVSAAANNEQGLSIENLQSILQDMGFSPQQQAAVTGVATAAATEAPAATPSNGDSAVATATAVVAAAAAEEGAAAAASSAGEAEPSQAAPVATAASTGISGGEGLGETNPSGESGGESQTEEKTGDDAETEGGGEEGAGDGARMDE